MITKRLSHAIDKLEFYLKFQCFPLLRLRKTLRFSGNEITCFGRHKSLTVCYSSCKKSQTWKSRVVLNKVTSINQISQNVTNWHSHESSSSKYSKYILVAMPWGMTIWYTQSIFLGYLFGYPGLCSELFFKEPQPIRKTNNPLEMFWMLLKSDIIYKKWKFD